MQKKNRNREINFKINPRLTQLDGEARSWTHTIWPQSLALQSSHSVHALNNYTKIYHYSHFGKTKVPINLFSFPDSQSQWKNLWTLHFLRNAFLFLRLSLPCPPLSFLLISSFFLPFFSLSFEKTSTVWHKYDALLTFSSQCQRRKNFSAETRFLAH